ncbi:MAG: ATP12 family protein [Erythrobacter sp.]
MKRFYDDVGTRSVEGSGWQVTLDGRGLKTVKGTAQIVPTQRLATALAQEWEDQSEELDPATFPIRDMVDYAIDVVGVDTAAAAGKIVAYGDTDTLLYRADPDEPLYPRQIDVWEPIVADFEAREGVEMTRVSGVIHRPQNDAALAHLRERLGAQSPFALAGIELMTSLAASLIVGLTASETDDEAEAMALWQAASLEEEWQADLWGRDPEAEERRAKRQSDFLEAQKATRLAI